VSVGGSAINYCAVTILLAIQQLGLGKELVLEKGLGFG